jgi:hypothetical protein
MGRRDAPVVRRGKALRPKLVRTVAPIRHHRIGAAHGTSTL